MFENLYEPLPWDSLTFGYKVARISATAISPATLTQLLGYLKETGFALVYWSVKPDNLFLNLFAEQAGGNLVDEKVTYSLRLPPPLLSRNTSTNLIKLYPEQEPSSDLLQLAWQSGHSSRFNRDPHFKNNEFEKLYSAWLQNATTRKNAREVLIHDSEDKITGFITLEENENTGRIGLFAVDEPARRAGIGQQLLLAGLHRFLAWGCNAVQVSTQQRNRVACKFYEKHGFTLQNQEQVYHLWL